MCDVGTKKNRDWWLLALGHQKSKRAKALRVPSSLLIASWDASARGALNPLAGPLNSFMTICHFLL